MTKDFDILIIHMNAILISTNICVGLNTNVCSAWHGCTMMMMMMKENGGRRDGFSTATTCIGSFGMNVLYVTMAMNE